MFMIANLIEPPMGKLILNHLIGNKCPEFRDRFLDSYFFKLTFGSDCLELYFWTVAFKTNQKYQSISNQSFKRNLAHMPCLNLTPKLSFESCFRMFIITGYYTKKQTLELLGQLVTLLILI